MFLVGWCRNRWEQHLSQGMPAALHCHNRRNLWTHVNTMCKVMVCYIVFLWAFFFNHIKTMQVPFLSIWLILSARNSLIERSLMHAQNKLKHAQYPPLEHAAARPHYRCKWVLIFTVMCAYFCVVSSWVFHTAVASPYHMRRVAQRIIHSKMNHRRLIWDLTHIHLKTAVERSKQWLISPCLSPTDII